MPTKILPKRRRELQKSPSHTHTFAGHWSRIFSFWKCLFRIWLPFIVLLCHACEWTDGQWMWRASKRSAQQIQCILLSLDTTGNGSRKFQSRSLQLSACSSVRTLLFFLCSCAFALCIWKISGGNFCGSMVHAVSSIFAIANKFL